MSPVTVHWIRHGKVASHRGDVPLTEEGVAQAQERGKLLAERLTSGEIVHFMYAPTLRTRQTAVEIRTSMAGALTPGSEVELLEVREQWAVRNPDIFVAGQRVEMVSSAEALSQQLHAPPIGPKTLSQHPFFSEFWASSDRIGYWVGHPDPPGESTEAVARRQLTFALSLPDLHEDRPARYVLSTHSPVLRSILLGFLGEDPGEPEYLEPVDLIATDEGTSELRFRDHRTFLSDTRVINNVTR